MSASPRTCAVCVTYYPDVPRLRRVIAATIPQVDGFLVVDNTPLESVGPEATALIEEAGAERLAMLRNIGLAEAQNRGIVWARARGFDRVLFLDQDSVPAADLVAHLSGCLDAAERDGRRVAAVGAAFFDPRVPEPPSFLTLSPFLHRRRCRGGSHEAVEAQFLIASGSMIPMTAIDATGPMDSGLFIDYVDTDWCLRARAAGLALLGVCEARLEHPLGDQALRVWTGRWRRVALHSPNRLYYIFRNGPRLYRRAYAPAGWIVCDVLRLLRMAVFYLLMIPPRRRYLAMVLRGLRDGLRGTEGALTLGGIDPPLLRKVDPPPGV